MRFDITYLLFSASFARPSSDSIQPLPASTSATVCLTDENVAVDMVCAQTMATHHNQRRSTT